MQDIQSQGATSPNRTLSLTADEAGMTWHSNAQLDISIRTRSRINSQRLANSKPLAGVSKSRRAADGRTIRHLAIRFQSRLRNRDKKKLEEWLHDAEGCGIPVVVNFARTPMVDILAVRNAVIEPWSNGQTEGHRR